MAFAAIAVPLQIFVGDLHGLNVAQAPAGEARGDGSALGIAARAGVPLVLFAVPNEREERNDYEIAIPKLGSVVLTHTLDGEIQPLKAVPRERSAAGEAGVLRVPRDGRASAR